MENREVKKTINDKKKIKLGDNIDLYVSKNDEEYFKQLLNSFCLDKDKDKDKDMINQIPIIPQEHMEKLMELQDIFGNLCNIEEKHTSNKNNSININDTFHVDKPKGEMSCDNKGGCKMTVKEQPNEEKIIRDKINQLEKGDKVKIVQGDFKVLKDIECTFLEYCEGMNKVLIQLDELNVVYVNPLDIELIKPKISIHDIKYSKRIAECAEIVIIDNVIVKNRKSNSERYHSFVIQTGNDMVIYCDESDNFIYQNLINKLPEQFKQHIKINKVINGVMME